MTSVFPLAADDLAADKANETVAYDDHPLHHDELADAINAVQAALLTDTIFPVAYEGGGPSKTAAQNAAAIALAEAKAAAAGGIVFFGPGTWTTQAGLVPRTGVTYAGCGIDATTLKLADGANLDLCKTDGFDGLTGTDSTGGPWNFGLRDLTLDGNKAHNTAGAGLRLYGFFFILENLRIRNCAGDGIWSEWGTAGHAPDPPGFGMEARVSNVTVHSNGGNGVHWRGPHDSMFSGVVSHSNGGAGIWTETGATFAANGCQFNLCHAWGAPQAYAWRIEAGVNVLTNCQGEGGSLAQILLNAADPVVVGCRFFDDIANAGRIGIEFGANCTGALVDAKVQNCTAGAVKFTGANPSGELSVVCFLSPSATAVPTFSGSSTSCMQHVQAGGNYTGASVLKWTLPAGIGKGWTLRGDATGDILNVNGGSALVELPNGAKLRTYSDGYATLTAQLDAATGKLDLRHGGSLYLSSDDGTTNTGIWDGATGNLTITGLATLAGGVLARGTATKVFTATDGTNDIFNVNGASRRVDVPYGCQQRFYSDGYSTATMILDGSGGHLTMKGSLIHQGASAGFFNHAPATQQAVAGSRGGNAALASLLAALTAYGLVVDGSTA